MYNNTYGNYPIYQSPYTNNYGMQLQQNRLNAMEQNYPQYGNTMQQNTNINNMQILKGRPVSSFDEAKASMIDLDGSLFIFPDIANNRIYTKQINLDGTASLKTYSLIEQNGNNNNQGVNTGTVANPSSEYIKRTEFEEYMKNINDRFNYLMEVSANEHKSDDATNNKATGRKLSSNETTGNRK